MPTHRLRLSCAGQTHLMFAESEREVRTILEAMAIAAWPEAPTPVEPGESIAGEYVLQNRVGEAIHVAVGVLAPMRQTSGTIG
jgi:hypothetical protein